MPRLPRPIARALEDWLDANRPLVEPWNARQTADHINALHLPGLAGQTATPANVRAAAAAIGLTIGKPAHDPANTRLLVDNLVAMANALEARADVAASRINAVDKSRAELEARLAALADTVEGRWTAALAAARRVAGRLEALEERAGIHPPADAPAA